MSRKQYFVCDRCSERIEVTDLTGSIPDGARCIRDPRQTNSPGFAEAARMFDLCPRCVDLLTHWLATPGCSCRSCVNTAD